MKEMVCAEKTILPVKKGFNTHARKGACRNRSYHIFICFFLYFYITFFLGTALYLSLYLSMFSLSRWRGKSFMLRLVLFFVFSLVH